MSVGFVFHQIYNNNKNLDDVYGMKGEGVKVLKLDNRSIIDMIDSSSKSCLEMFSSRSLYLKRLNLCVFLIVMCVPRGVIL